MRKRVACGSAVALLLAGACKKPQILVPQAPEPPSDVVAALARAYQTRDVDLLASLLCSDPATNTEFAFLFEPAHTNGETQWGWDEETRLHRRMFHPELPAAGEPPLPPALWLDGIEITFTPLESFQERRDLYSENGGVDGKLDPQRWRAVDARHATYMLFDGPDNDYLAAGESNFVVVEDLTKPSGASGKFLLYRWEDLCRPAASEIHGITRLCPNVVKEWYR